MKEIDLNELGTVVQEYRDGLPFAYKKDISLGLIQIAEKINEIIKIINSYEK